MTIDEAGKPERAPEKRWRRRPLGRKEIGLTVFLFNTK